LERIKNIFLYPNQAKNDFEKSEDTKKEKIVKTLLWNASFEKQKIAHLSYKEPYNLLYNIEDKSNFLSVRRVRDSNPRGAFTPTSLAVRRFRPTQPTLHVAQSKFECITYRFSLTVKNLFIYNHCGGTGIRTLGRLSPTTVFKTAALNRSAIPPH